MSNLRDLNLKPRAVAILVALRMGPRSVGQLADSIADDDMTDTARLLGVMEMTHMVICRLPVGSDGKIRFMLTHDGIGWLQFNGLDASSDAKRQLYDLLDSKSMELLP